MNNMNRSDLIKEVMKVVSNKKDATAAVDKLLDSIIESLKKGQSVTLREFGTFNVLEDKRFNDDKKETAKLSNEQLKKKAKQAETKPAVEITIKDYPRNPYVVQYVKRRANGKCELCKKEAPFCSKEREPFLECHHIKEMANKGKDSIENAVALCPNCHRKMHHLRLDSDKKKLKMKAKK
jgi:nucleoid DNA-binding protein